MILTVNMAVDPTASLNVPLLQEGAPSCQRPVPDEPRPRDVGCHSGALSEDFTQFGLLLADSLVNTLM
jgi:hypothetical protein